MNMPKTCCDVLVVGAGLAGLSVALSLPQHLRVIILAKDDLATCASNRAQGGIAAVMDQHDTFADHIHDTLVAGDGVCNADSVGHIVQAGAEVIQWLQAQHVPFTYQDDGQLHLTREGGHGQRRVVHTADHTGWSITHTLQQQLSQHPNIQVLSQVRVQRLWVDNQICVGAEVVYADGGVLGIQAADVVLASGGLGQLFALTTNPTTATGDGIALAAEAGCRLGNLAYVQFHPTALALPQNPCFLISEAVRGEGGLLRNAQGERFMPSYDARAELAPRDVVARAIATEMQRSQQAWVYLDTTHMPAAFIQSHFPTIYQHCWQQHQLDLSQTWIPVAPAAHYACGGVLTDQEARTDVAHLYAVGEVACTGLHGANRLASNSLLECVVMGRAAALSIVGQHAWSSPQLVTDSQVMWLEVLAHSPVPDNTKQQPFSISQLQHSMGQHFGIVRSFEGMTTLWQQLWAWYQQVPAQCSEQRLPLMCALLLVYSGLQLQSNHGAHFNVDLHKPLERASSFA